MTCRLIYLDRLLGTYGILEGNDVTNVTSYTLAWQQTHETREIYRGTRNLRRRIRVTEQAVLSLANRYHGEIGASASHCATLAEHVSCVLCLHSLQGTLVYCTSQHQEVVCTFEFDAVLNCLCHVCTISWHCVTGCTVVIFEFTLYSGLVARVWTPSHREGMSQLLTASCIGECRTNGWTRDPGVLWMMWIRDFAWMVL